MKNQEIADLFERMARLLEIKGDNVFKIRAYDTAAENLRLASEDVETLRREDRLGQIHGLGSALREKIGEYLDTGRVGAYDSLTHEIPESVLELVNIPSVGPKKARLFFDQLRITNLADLKQALAEGRLSGLAGIKEKTLANISKGIETVEAGRQRMDLGAATRLARTFVEALEKLDGVKKIAVAGSLRRRKETVRDIDILIVSDRPQPVMQTFVRLPAVAQINAYGDTKSSIMTADHVQVDLRVVEEKSFGAALLYFTGSKSFNVTLRQRAVRQKMKINEYGIFSVKERGEKRLAGTTEEECFRALGFPYVPPELREDIGEAELFGTKKPCLPDLVEFKDIRGDLHVHSLWSDGHQGIEELAKSARDRNYAYLGICDHSAGLKVARGVSAEDLKKKKKEIEAINKRYKDLRILFGTEVEIDKQGNLDYNDKILRDFDIVIAALHTSLGQDGRQLTRRLVNACRHKYVDVIAHPFSRHLGKREPLDIDFSEICRAAAETGTILEINAFPTRLDLDSAHVYFAGKHGVRVMVNTDAHQTDHMDFMEFGVDIARRGWLTADQVVNTLPLGKFLKTLKRSRVAGHN